MKKLKVKKISEGTFNTTSIAKTTGEVNKVTYHLPGGKEQTITF